MPCSNHLSLRWHGKRCIQLVAATVVFLVICDQLGVTLHIAELDYQSEFRYPLEEDVSSSVESLKLGLEPDIHPINQYNYPFISDARRKCLDLNGNLQPLRLVYIVKSALDHLERRAAIRYTWGFEKRFSDVDIRRVFLVGKGSDAKVQRGIDAENAEHGDIVQADFADTYYNNTIKTMMGVKWAANYCSKAMFYAIVDDDVYISTKNLLRFLKHPTAYPQYWKEAFFASEQPAGKKTNVGVQRLKQVESFLDQQSGSRNKLYAGKVMHKSPLRHKFSTWYISVEEYPFSMWPPYVTGGATILSGDTMIDFYYMSHYVKHFRFDDIYLALLAKKLGITPLDNPEFHIYPDKPYASNDYEYVIAAHGYSNPQLLTKAWNEQKSLGNA
ncbi:unnamed protein product [Darwinula stevensoni]|uniref:Hexosyltransferase n=1 Tax=Darwinula stevensoni TaxID=69355 RepID=A0A7R9FP14_9CRUS|nr:unnamed protein product [Darwinula stevensoni]CAG0897075.1 unnamed protein product [Darwinula stevensoni]